VKGRLKYHPSPASSNGSFPPPENQPNTWRFAFSFLAALFAGTAIAQYPPERTPALHQDRSRKLRRKSRPIAKPDLPIEQILALPAESPGGSLSGANSTRSATAFQFKGLPVGQITISSSSTPPPLRRTRLSREASTLPTEDLQKIERHDQKSEPFLTKKSSTGSRRIRRGNTARAICTYFREKGSELLLSNRGKVPTARLPPHFSRALKECPALLANRPRRDSLPGG